MAQVGASAATFEEALGCDYVSLHLPLTDATRGLIGRGELALFKPHGVLINIARGAIVDTDALVEALREGRLAGAGLDVVSPAPLPPEHPFWTHPRILATPHIAAETNPPTAAALIRDAIRRFEAGQPVANIVDLDRGY